MQRTAIAVRTTSAGSSGAGAGGVAAQQVDLEMALELGRDRVGDERAEARQMPYTGVPLERIRSSVARLAATRSIAAGANSIRAPSPIATPRRA